MEVKADKFLQWKKFTCEVCSDLELNGQHEWQRHLKSKKHGLAERRERKRKSGMTDREYYAQMNAKKRRRKEEVKGGAVGEEEEKKEEEEEKKE